MQVRKRIIRNLQNIPGWKTREKIVVIESDDWGTIRMPSKKVYDSLLKKGYAVDNDPFMKYDSLETSHELTSLIEVLSTVKDRNGNYPVMTLNFIMANPLFDNIQKSGFREYTFENFYETYSRQPGCEQSFAVIKEGMGIKVFKPQCHGREHLNVDRWMHDLCSGDKSLLEAFDNGMLSISSQNSSMTFDYMEALDYFSESEKAKKPAIVDQALKLFQNTFGYASGSFMACCFIWDDPVENELSRHHVQNIQGIVQQLKPDIEDGQHKFRRVYHFTGQKNRNGQNYLVRNCFFEPSLTGYNDAVEQCLSDIRTAFFYNKPAIISSHRLNFAGSIDQANMDQNLSSFSLLLTEITKRWPEVIFMSSDKLGLYISSAKS